MRTPASAAAVLATVALVTAASSRAAGQPVSRVIELAAGQAAGAAAVIVDDVPLVHTAQFATATGPLDRQVVDSIAQLRTALQSLGSGRGSRSRSNSWPGAAPQPHRPARSISRPPA
jgi:hypothetical protein